MTLVRTSASPSPGPRGVSFAASVSLAIGITYAIVLAPAAVNAQTPGKSAIAEAGEQSYLELCASCHGNDARGHGVQAAELDTAPPDLTLMASRRGGEFSLPDLARYIDGREMPDSHGTGDMPAWGEHLSGEIEDDEMAERVVRGQVLEILVYLESIQR